MVAERQGAAVVCHSTRMHDGAGDGAMAEGRRPEPSLRQVICRATVTRLRRLRAARADYSGHTVKNLTVICSFPPALFEDSGSRAARALQPIEGTEDIMTILDRLIPQPAMVEIDTAELAVDGSRAWKAVRALDLAASTFVRTLFAVRTIPDRL